MYFLLNDCGINQASSPAHSHRATAPSPPSTAKAAFHSAAACLGSCSVALSWCALFLVCVCELLVFAWQEGLKLEHTQKIFFFYIFLCYMRFGLYHQMENNVAIYYIYIRVRWVLLVLAFTPRTLRASLQQTNDIQWHFVATINSTRDWLKVR